MVPRLAALLVLLLVACTTSPLGRSQLRLFPESEISRMGVAAFEQLKSETPVSGDRSTNRYVRCVADAVTRELTGAWAGRSWEVTVFQDDAVNAFALPGGKIGVYTGLLEVARNQNQLATVIGHEVAHVLADHSNERISTAFVAQSGLQLVEALSGAPSPTQQRLMGLLGVGAQVGVLLPFGRAQESEADLLGIDLMASAGFDPRESVALWHNMGKAGGEQPPEFLSTHPSHETRIQDLEARMPLALERYDKARNAGKRPDCD